MDGPYPGSRHDAGILRESGIVDVFEDILENCIEGPFYIYGDAGYPQKSYLMNPFDGAYVGELEGEFNKPMSACRICVQMGIQENYITFCIS